MCALLHAHACPKLSSRSTYRASHPSSSRILLHVRVHTTDAYCCEPRNQR